MGAAKYEVRVYKGSRLIRKKTGITKLSWKCTRPLPRGVRLSWKVRAVNAVGAGPWSGRPLIQSALRLPGGRANKQSDPTTPGRSALPLP